MSWLGTLNQTYEHALALDISDEGKPVPIAHTVQNAHITIVIDGAGRFRRATVLDKAENIVLPVTEKSAGRTSGKVAHALADKLQYVAGDYAAHGGTKPGCFALYLKQLEKWCASAHAHPSAQAVLAYVKKETVIADLIEHEILWVDEKGELRTRWDPETEEPPQIFKVLPKKDQRIEPGDALVRWTVERPGYLDAESWRDNSLQQRWTKFDDSESAAQSLCYVTGEIDAIAASHPAKLRHSGDSAKLISSNDASGFTFRGRFTDGDGTQAAAVGSATSQKAHSALRWLLKRQGFRNDTQYIVAWAVSGKHIPEPIAATFDFDLYDLSMVSAEQVAEDTEAAGTDHGADLGKTYATNLNSCMAGYRAKLEADDTISIIAIDSATPGRMGITYYRESVPDDYIEQLQAWHLQFAWYQRVSRDAGTKQARIDWLPSAPAPAVIARCVYGELLKGNNTLLKNFYLRIIPCILEGRSLPTDLLDLAVKQASNPNGKEAWAWEKSLGVACALYRGHFCRHPHITQRREISMTLDVTTHSRDYLYGRLLAVADYIEYIALQVANENRSTNAERLMQRFADRPFSTWRIIELSLRPYMQRLKVTRGGFLTNRERELDEIHNAFDTSDFNSDRPLSGEFLLGFHTQRLELRTRSASKQEPQTTGDKS